MPTVKCVLVGDGAVGKTSLLVSYAASECPSSHYVPTAADNYAGQSLTTHARTVPAVPPRQEEMVPWNLSYTIHASMQNTQAQQPCTAEV